MFPTLFINICSLLCTLTFLFPETDTDNIGMDPERQAIFAQKSALQKEAKLRRKAAQAAAAEKKAAQAAAAEKKSAQVAQEAEERAAMAAKQAEETAARVAKEAGAQMVPGHRVDGERCQGKESRDNIPLAGRKRKTILDPDRDVIDMESPEIQSGSSQHTTFKRARSTSGFPVSKGNIFKRGLVSEGSLLFGKLMTPSEEAFL